MINHFYATLPSNDGSIKYYPQNTNHSWKNRLSHRIDLEGDWEVGLASISLPCQSLLQDYLQTLKADDVLLRTVCKVYNTLSRSYDTKITIVRNKDVQDKRLVTVHDLIEALFDVEHDYFVIALDKTFYINLTNKHLQLDVSLDEESETSKNIKTYTLSLDTVAAFVQVMLREDLCRLFQWIQDGPPALDRTLIIQNGNNLTLEKNRQGWHESLSKRQSGVRKHSLTLYDLSFSLNFKAVVFYLHEVTWTFLNTKTCTYKKDNKPRSLYVYSSLCNPVMVGDQTTVLLRQVPYRPLLTGTYSYNAPIIQYVKLRNPHIEEIETEISETDTNQLVQFSQGATILTVHFRKTERHVQ